MDTRANTTFEKIILRDVKAESKGSEPQVVNCGHFPSYRGEWPAASKSFIINKIIRKIKKKYHRCNIVMIFFKSSFI